MQALAVDFQWLVHQHDVGALARWLERAEASQTPELRGFAEGIRLKETKRMMYGRAKLDLLRLCVFHPV